MTLNVKIFFSNNVNIGSQSYRKLVQFARLNYYWLLVVWYILEFNFLNYICFKYKNKFIVILLYIHTNKSCLIFYFLFLTVIYIYISLLYYTYHIFFKTIIYTHVYVVLSKFNKIKLEKVTLRVWLICKKRILKERNRKKRKKKTIGMTWK